MQKGILTLILAILFFNCVFAQLKEPDDLKRSRAYFKIIRQITFKQLKGEQKRRVIDQVVPALIDPQVSIRMWYGQRMMYFKKEEFTPKGLNIIRKAFLIDSLVNFYSILLIGQLDLKEYEKDLYRFINKDRVSNQKIKYGSKEWAARLALARFGHQESIDFVVSTVNNEKYESIIYFDLLGFLAYVRQRPTTDILIEKLFSDAQYEYSPSETPIKTETYYYAPRTLPMLASLIEDFPIKKPSIYGLEDLKVVRDWFTANNRQYQIREDSAFVPRRY